MKLSQSNASTPLQLEAPLAASISTSNRSGYAIADGAGLENGQLLAGASAANNLVFIDSSISHYQELATAVKPGTEVYLLNPLEDAVQQITQILLGKTDVASLSILSHGSAGSLQLGATSLNSGTIASYASQLQTWANALTNNADLLLYGCNVGEGQVGANFIQQLAQITGADVAASNDLTGNSTLGGDWSLEVQTGAIEAAPFFPSDLSHYTGLLASPVVTLPGGAIAYTENASPTIIDSGATVTDADNPSSFNNGVLTVSLTNGIASDRLGIRNQGNGAGQIGLDGRIVKYGSAQIGTFTGGTGSENLVVSLNNAATPVAVAALLKNLTYSNVADNLPPTSSRTISATLNDGTGQVSNPVTKTVSVNGVNDTPFIGSKLTLYNGATNLLPTAAAAAPNGPWFDYRETSVLGGTQSRTAGDGGTTLVTDNQIYAGYSNYQFTQNPGFTNVTFTSSQINAASFPTLDRNAGFVFSFSIQVVDETRTSGADKNNDGKDDRAGFSVTLLGNDRKGIELGFWKDRIWAQDDGTTQANPSLEPDTANNNALTFFTQAEGVDFNTTSLVNYDLAIKANSYTLFANGNPILSGRVRDYTAFVPPVYTVGISQITLPDPYELPNFIFFGDGTPTAGAQVKITSVSLATNTPPLPAQTVNEDTPLILPASFIGDIDSSSSSPFTVTIAAQKGKVTVNSSIAGGLTTGNITGNGSSTVTLSGTLAQINTTLNSANALTYQGNPDYFGNDTLTLTANDGGTNGIATRTIPITVAPVNDRPSFIANDPSPITNISGTQTLTNWASFNPGAANEAGQTATYTVSNISNPSLFAPGSAPAIAANGTLTYTPASGVTGTSTFQVAVKDNGGTAIGGQDTSLVQTFTITVNAPNTTGGMASDFNNDGFVDILWRNYATGQNGVWYMNGTTYNTAVSFTTVADLNWQLQATGDFNRDGYTDLVWRNDVAKVTGIWLMNGLSIASVVTLPTVDTGWRVAGTADFNQDGNLDLLWQNTSNGQAGFWFLNGTSLTSFAVLNPPVSVEWRIEGVGDFNQDGKADIVWRNYKTGDNGVWLMNGTTLSSVQMLLKIADLNWQIAALADYNRDGQVDLFWRNSATGDNGIWMMNGTSLSSVVPLQKVDKSWRSLNYYARPA